MSGRLYGVGLGPGDPELVTIKARRLIEAAAVVAFPTARRGQSVARQIAAPYLRPGQTEIAMTFPLTTEPVDAATYEASLRDFYDRSAAEIAAQLDAGRDVVILCEGDPLFYGSYMYLHERLAHRYPTEVVPGVTSFSAAAAAVGQPLAKQDDIFTVLPATLPQAVLTERLGSTDAAVVLKLGRTFGGVRAAAERAGVADRAVYVERAGSDRQRIAALRDVEEPVPYMSLVLVPTATQAGRAIRRPRAGALTVVGLGPAGPEWLTREAESALAEAEDLVGYGPYLARVPVRPGQRRHPSDNRAESERARLALRLAAEGNRVTIVSSGDPGIFAMATAVLETVAEAGSGFADLPLRVVPGISAMQAVAARTGAPLGHDFCVISLSDQLKPWDVIERRIEAAATADMVLVFYNPASRLRRRQLERAHEVLLRHRAIDTPVIAARDVGGAEERVVVTTLGELDLASVDMRTLLVVGSSTTTLIPGPAGPRVYTPRRYPG